jgi:hypothetical protein
MLPKKIAQIKAPNNNPQRIPSSHPLDGMTCEAVSTAMAILVKAIIFIPLRMEIHGCVRGSFGVSAFFFFEFFDTVAPEIIRNASMKKMRGRVSF